MKKKREFFLKALNKVSENNHDYMSGTYEKNTPTQFLSYLENLKKLIRSQIQEKNWEGSETKAYRQIAVMRLDKHLEKVQRYLDQQYLDG